MKRTFVDFFIGALLFGLDRWVKMIALSSLSAGSSIEVGSLLGIDLSWTLTSNEGAAWGLFTDTPRLLFIFRVLFILLLLWGYIFSNLGRFVKTSLIVVLAGALSNLFDTMVWGHVIDMIHLRLWGFDYPVFNIADIGICLGCIGIIAPLKDG